jgi:phosphatidylinositol 3,5-bisphosphate 5-phosphatase
MGYSSLYSQALSAPPYLVAFIAVIITARISDRMRSRSIPIVFHALIACLGYALSAIAGHLRWHNIFRYLSIFPAVVGFFSAITIIITWTLNNQRSGSKKGTGIALLNFIGQCGPLLGTKLYPEKDAPYYVYGMTICSCFMGAVVILALGLRIILQRENRRLGETSKEEVAIDLEHIDSREAIVPLVGDRLTIEASRFLNIL